MPYFVPLLWEPCLFLQAIPATPSVTVSRHSRYDALPCRRERNIFSWSVSFHLDNLESSANGDQTPHGHTYSQVYASNKAATHIFYLANEVVYSNLFLTSITLLRGIQCKMWILVLRVISLLILARSQNYTRPVHDTAPVWCYLSLKRSFQQIFLFKLTTCLSYVLQSRLPMQPA